MSFFKKFDTIQYQLDGYSKEAMNIVTAAVLKRLNVDKTYVYQSYIVPAGASPESLANDLYKDPHKHWTILLVNSIVNPFLDWPVNDQVLEELVVREYGSAHKIVHFIDMATKFQLDDVQDAVIRQLIEDGNPIPQNIRPVTALEYEIEKNRRKAQITVVAPKYINRFVDAFNKSIEGKA